MKKVLLIATNSEKKPYPVPPIGLSIVAQSIEKKYDVKMYDAMFDEGASLEATVKSFNPDYIGCSIRNVDSMSVEAPDFFLETIDEKIIRPLKKLTDVPIILGGSGYSIYPYEILDFFGLDYGIAGEGEETFAALLEHLDKNTDITGIKGIINRCSPDFEKKIITNSAYPKEKYFSGTEKFIDFIPYKERGAYSIQSKRGCAHQCIYCTYPLIEGKKFRTREAKDIVDEIQQVSERLGDVVFEFVDSTFNDPAGHAENICSEIIRRNLNVRIRTMGINPANTSDKLFELMIKAGFTQIDSTPDSASPLMLKNLRKNFTLEQLQKMAVQIQKSGLPTMWFFVFGGPGETLHTIDETFDFIRTYISPDDMVYLTTSLRIYPETSLYHTALKENLIQPGQSLLRPVFYSSENFPVDKLHDYLQQKIGRSHNLLFSSEAKPSPDMMKEAIQIRKQQNLTEPMFRTLLRIRKRMMEEGKIL
ncbi:MAG TPA: radical SAM protein [Bacteroidales bacterium]|nr:radical SAM protein [Bacteroidales bacterium]